MGFYFCFGSPFKVVGVVEEIFYRAEFLYQFDGRFFSYAGSTGYIVRRVAHET